VSVCLSVCLSVCNIFSAPETCTNLFAVKHVKLSLEVIGQCSYTEILTSDGNHFTWLYMAKQAESMRGEMQRMPCRMCVAYGVHSVHFRSSWERRIASTLIRRDAVYHRNEHLIYSHVTFMTLQLEVHYSILRRHKRTNSLYLAHCCQLYRVII